jgi:thioesterase domain-containing protein
LRFTDNNLVLIKNGLKKDRNIFFIHAGSGEINVYSEICKNLDENFNCWGIKFDELTNFNPINGKMTDLAGKYIKKIKMVQEKGPYSIAGWCIGGTIAFEMARQLETMGDEVEFLGLINSIAPKRWDDIDEFSIKSELSMIESFTDSSFIKSILIENDGDIWMKALNLMKKRERYYVDRLKYIMPGHIAKSIPDINNAGIEHLVYYVNVLRTLHNIRSTYYPENCINANMHFFIAEDDNEIIENSEENLLYWSRYIKLPMVTHKVTGDHFGMFCGDNAVTLSSMLNTLISGRE